jgi:hypothetical protein
MTAAAATAAAAAATTVYIEPVRLSLVLLAEITVCLYEKLLT